MTTPDPVPGLIVGFSFLWSHEAARGLTEGQKDRPCVVIATFDAHPGKRAILAPITHTAPLDPAEAIALPAAIKSRLGLDDSAAWLVCSELNITNWPGFDLRPAAGRPAGTFHYGMLPPGLYEDARQLVTRLHSTKQAKTVSRL